MHFTRIWQGTALELTIPPGKTRKDVIGGKADSLCNMHDLGLDVPPAVVIPVEHSRTYRKLGIPASTGFLQAITYQLGTDLNAMHDLFGYAPLLSVRSGAAISMPGMMDTILNIGLTDDTLPEWCARIGARAAHDSYRRLIQMLGSTAFGIDAARFEERLDVVKQEAGVESDSALDVPDLVEAIKLYKACFEAYAFRPFPQDVVDQLTFAVEAVFASWDNPRAVEYRKLNKISDDLGTAVTVQAMVFGNMNDQSATGVLFSRNPSTGQGGMTGEFLINAQGEDVVAGIRTPVDIEEMRSTDIALWNTIYDALDDVCASLEDHYLDMVDIEFTVQDGKLFILQCRPGKRAAIAAFRIGRDLVLNGVISFNELCGRLTRAQYRTATRPALDPSFKGKPVATGLPACPGVVTGRVVRSAKEAVAASDPVILVTHETDPDDIAGMAAAVGILTKTGGATSHAAVVARAMDKACVVGCTGLELQGKLIGFDGVVMSAKTLSICGSTGRVWAGEVPTVDGSQDEALQWFATQAMLLRGVEDIGPVPAGTYTRISAVEWWGHDIVAQAVVDELASLPTREGITLDLRAPIDLMPPGDIDILAIAGPDALDEEGSAFASYVVALLVEKKLAVGGLTVIGVPYETQRKALRGYGVRCAGQAKTVADLLSGDPVEVSGAFIEDIAGGKDAYEKLAEILALSGHTLRSLRVAEPRDYSALSVIPA